MYGSVVPVNDWIALLSISTRYVFDKIRDMAIQELTKRPLDPVKRITLAEQFNVPQWLSTALVELTKRPEPVSDADAEVLGMRTVVRIARAREQVRQRGYVTSSERNYYPFDFIYRFDEKGIMQVVRDIWPECTASHVSSCQPELRKHSR